MKEQKDKNTKSILIIAVAILIVACLTLGITLAFFLRASIENTNEITSENLVLEYEDNKDTMYDGLIPIKASEVIEKGVGTFGGTEVCKDKGATGDGTNPRNVCALYEFKVKNASTSKQLVDFYLDQQLNGYTNLKYMIYNTGKTGVTTSVTPIVGTTSISAPADPNNDYPGTKINIDSILIDGGKTETYTIVFFVDEIDDKQNASDASKKLLADVHVIGRAFGTYTAPTE